MRKIKMKNKNGCLEMSNRLSKTERIHYEGLKLINSGAIPGLTRIEVCGKGAVVLLKANIVNAVSFNDYFSSRLDTDNLLMLINAVMKIALDCERMGLSPDNLAWSLHSVFVDIQTGSVRMVYWPLFELASAGRQMLLFFSQIMSTAAWSGLDSQLAQKYENYFYQRETMRLQDFQHVVDEMNDLLQKRRSTMEIRQLRKDTLQGIDSVKVNPIPRTPKSTAQALLESVENGVQLLIRQEGTIVGRQDAAVASLSTGGTVSKQHVRIMKGKKGDYFVITDLGSRNGTRVNGNKLKPGQRVQLADGMRVCLGTCEFIFRSLETNETVVIYKK